MLPETKLGEADAAVPDPVRPTAVRHPHDCAPALQVTASAGLAAAHPGESLDDLLIRADHALDAAKLAGRNRIVRSGA